MGHYVIVMAHRLFFTPMKRPTLILLATITSASMFGLSPLEREVKTIYEDAVFRGVQPESLIDRVNAIPTDSIENFTDSIRYSYHYMKAGVMDIQGINNEEKIAHIDAALQLREKSIGIKDSEYLELIWAKGSDIQEKDPAQAMRMYQKGVVVGQSMIAENLPAVDYWYGKLLDELGSLYEDRGYTQQAISLYREGFQLTSRNYSEDDASSWLPLYRLEYLYYKQGQYEEAVSVCDEILGYLESHQAQQTKHYADVINVKNDVMAGMAVKLNDNGVQYLLSGDGESALPLLNKAKGIFESLKLESTPVYATTLHNIGRANMLCENYPEAKSYLEQAKALQIKVEGQVFERTQQYLDEVNASIK